MLSLDERTGPLAAVLVTALVACGPGDSPETSARKGEASAVERSGRATAGTTSGTPSSTRASGDTLGPTDRPGVPLEPVHSARDTLPLLLIMRNLERNMVAVQAGVWRGDYRLIREAARAMADHARIPTREIERIRSALGEEGLKGFVAADRRWHERATDLAEAAGERDMSRIVDFTADLLRRCSSCHVEYRRPLRESPEW